MTKHMSNLFRFQHEDKLLTLQAQHPKRLHIQIFHSRMNSTEMGSSSEPVPGQGVDVTGKVGAPASRC